ncbi:MAG: AAA family ATPase [Lachnospiraceae bacterium]|nr:AAA family ATPase [Lachnospiraceae bacterium]
MSNFFDMLDDLNRKRAAFSSDEIDKAQKIARKTGKSLMEVLQESTGKTMEVSSDTSDLMDLNQSLLNSTQKELDSLYAQMEKDFGTSPKTGGAASAGRTTTMSGAAASGKNATSSTTAAKAAAPVTLESFNGVEDVVKEKVFGQDALLKKLSVAFKRPFILPEEAGHAKNTFFIHGPKDSGKHYALSEITKELAKRNILSSDEVYKMDLSHYTAAGKDNVFLQDLYTALQSSAQVILFENYEGCHISYLSYVSDLVIKGECYLQDRYMLQNGQLIAAPNAFTKETVSSFKAAGKYLAFLSTKNVEGLANVFGAPFVNALGDICASNKLEEESYKKMAKVRFDELIAMAKKQFSFIVKGDEAGILDAAVAATGRNVGTEGLVAFFDRLLKGLATLKLEGSYSADTEVVLSIADGRLIAAIGEESIDLMDHLPQAYTGDQAAVKAELDNIVGLSEVKKYILSLEEYYNTQKRRIEAGLKASEVSKHMIFTGNPGTGKTTIARIISRYLKAIGVLSGGQLVEVSRADLVGRYVGHTAPLVNQVIKSAIGGVLFIDEAYSLYRGKDDSFGLEAIDTLVKGIEDNRDNLIVILAGYSKEMEEFLASNSGLKSRFPNIIDFPDYSGEELLEITKITVKSKGYVLDEGAIDDLLAYYCETQMLRANVAGNGRLVRNKVEEAILNQSRRLVAEPEADLSLLTIADFDLKGE